MTPAQHIARTPRLAAAAALAAVSLCALAWSLRPPVRVAELAGFSEAAAHVAEQADAATFVVVWPPGQAAALAALPPGLRAADAVPYEPPQARRHFQIVVLGPSGFDTPPELADADDAPRRRFEEVEVATYAFARRDRVLYDLRAALPETKVRLTAPGTEIPCDQARPDGWGCRGRPDWNRVTAERMRVLGDEWPCVWAHPVAGHELVLDLGRRRLGDRIELEAALADAAAGTPGGAAVQLDLEIEGAARQTLWRNNQPGVTRLEAPTPRGEGAVRLVIRTTHDGRRHLGVNLRVLESP